jgi:hypothetical protein
MTLMNLLYWRCGFYVEESIGYRNSQNQLKLTVELCNECSGGGTVPSSAEGVLIANPN